ncbi:hypothetical protein QVD17_19188 [Tagetes erecta]|uniref:Uncharacterized protein n=1 Tax=Tagetes erecta TaxID=13708 RepID=A0AAD8KJG9_TARER|nr:hypothetical protein QVD17_19188 [Tagetes erecta]
MYGSYNSNLYLKPTKMTTLLFHPQCHPDVSSYPKNMLVGEISQTAENPPRRLSAEKIATAKLISTINLFVAPGIVVSAED